MAEIQFGSWRGEASQISDKFVMIFHSFSGFLINMNKHIMAKIMNTTYQTNSFKIIKSMFIIYELPHAPVVFPISLGIFNCFENSDRSENFRQTVPIYGWWWGGCPLAPPEFPPLPANKLYPYVSFLTSKITCHMMEKLMTSLTYLTDQFYFNSMMFKFFSRVF